jgi:hypothetical protein
MTSSANIDRSRPPRDLLAAGALALFLAWLGLPLVHAGLRRAGRVGGGELREAPPPRAAAGRPLADRLREFSAEYERTSPMRRDLLRLYMGMKVRILGAASIATLVVGRERWLFVGRESPTVDERRYFLGLRPFTADELDRWCRVLAERRRWLAERGIAYRLVVAPNKSSIYPERMPAGYPRGRRTRLDQLGERLAAAAPGFPLVDLRPALRAGKGRGLVYWPTDSHWNDLGRYLAYREIVGSLATEFPAMQALPAEDFAFVPGPRSRDLEELLLVPWDPPGPFLRMVPRRRLPEVAAAVEDGGAWTLLHCRRAPRRTAIVIHDSFGETLKPLLALHFRRSRWALDRSHAFPAAEIARLRPQVVIEEIVERYLDEEPWRNPPALPDRRLAGGKVLF